MPVGLPPRPFQDRHQRSGEKTRIALPFAQTTPSLEGWPGRRREARHPTRADRASRRPGAWIGGRRGRRVSECAATGEMRVGAIRRRQFLIDPESPAQSEAPGVVLATSAVTMSPRRRSAASRSNAFIRNSDSRSPCSSAAPCRGRAMAATTRYVPSTGRVGNLVSAPVMGADGHEASVRVSKRRSRKSSRSSSARAGARRVMNSSTESSYPTPVEHRNSRSSSASPARQVERSAREEPACAGVNRERRARSVAERATHHDAA